MMTNLDAYLAARGITEEQMESARKRTRDVIVAYSLKEARAACKMTQVEVARAMGVSQNRVSRMENGDLGAMSLDTVRRYAEALGGAISLDFELPIGKVHLT